MLESLQHTAQDTQLERQDFYRLAYQTMRGKLDVPSDQFRSLILRLLGDKAHEKIFHCDKGEEALSPEESWRDHCLLEGKSGTQARLKCLKEMGEDDGETLHGFRSGCAITLALSGVDFNRNNGLHWFESLAHCFVLPTTSESAKSFWDLCSIDF